MNRAVGSARPAPPAPLVVAADAAPAVMQSDTPASAAETPVIPLVASCASDDKEVRVIFSSAGALHHPSNLPSHRPFPPLPRPSFAQNIDPDTGSKSKRLPASR
jgi:hypothetical protein